MSGRGLLLTALVLASFGGGAAVRSARAADPPPPAADLPAFPTRTPADPARVANGKALFSVNCSFCHGATAKGGESGPSLVRSHVVLDDQNGELIEPIVHGGRPAKGMPPFSLTSAQIGDLAVFIHSIPVGEAAQGAPPVVNSLVGDAQAGRAYFEGPGKCRDCHSVTGDLQHVGTRLEPRELQSAMVAGGLRDTGLSTFFALPLFIPKGTTARVTLPSGASHTGALQHIDEFSVSIIDSVTGATLTYAREGSKPSVEVHDPIQAHLDLLRVLDDADIHNLTAYLATLK
jgi:cytochrome c oxidase cbb3-type subunit III